MNIILLQIMLFISFVLSLISFITVVKHSDKIDNNERSLERLNKLNISERFSKIETINKQLKCEHNQIEFINLNNELIGNELIGAVYIEPYCTRCLKCNKILKCYNTKLEWLEEKYQYYKKNSSKKLKKVKKEIDNLEKEKE